MNNRNLFEKFQVYETNNLLFTKVKIEDAIELFECYSDPITKSHMNNDNCGGEWPCYSIDVVIRGIKGWEREFNDRFYIRWSVKHKHINKIIGTIEIAPIPNTTRFWDGVCQTGILRIDIISYLGNEEIFSEILKMVTDNFYTDFDIENIIVKALPDDNQRILALKNYDFKELKDNDITPYGDYYIKKISSQLILNISN